MTAKILSLNIGGPKEMHWNGKTITSSMEKSPVPGPLAVHKDHIEGNSFSSPQFHGTLDSILYIYGLSSAQKFAERLGLEKYTPGMTGETLTVDHFDETLISVGDVFQIGEVKAQATFPRIPCGKVNFRMQHPEGQKAMQECGLSGVYLRILTEGKIHKTDTVDLVEPAKHRFSMFDLYPKMIKNLPPTKEEFEIMKANGAFPQRLIEKWTKQMEASN